MMKLKGFYLYDCFMLFFITINYFGNASRLSSQLNKTTLLKSIKSEDGDVIDCVDISHQPAFDHPLLKNHTIKMKPSYHPEGVFGQNKLSNFKETITQLWQLSGKCPEGTIPIRRTEEDDIVRASFTKKKHINNKNIPPRVAASARHQYAITQTRNGKFYGTKATISLWKPYVKDIKAEFSLSQIWIVAGPDSHLNTIEAGWIVYPKLFGDSRTRLFVYWTSDGYRSTGCYNLHCSGFVQTNSKIALGGYFSPNPGSHSEISILVWKDKTTNAWWLQYNGINVGYWPASLFTYLADSGARIVWGGEIINSNLGGKHTTTQMGSGRFPEAGFGRASYFRNLQFVDQSNTLRPPAAVSSYASHPNCYKVAVGKAQNWGDYFFYGGPGRNRRCP